MMTFIILTLSFTVAILLAGVISTIAIFAIMQNQKALNWFVNFYIKQMNKTAENFANIKFEEGEGL